SAEFTAGIRMADEAALAVKHRTVNGLSIGYRVSEEKSKRKADGKGRDIFGIDFLKEVSVVDWPADGNALIDVKSSIEEAESLKEIESLLRDAAGFSRADATALVSRIKSLSHGDRVDEQKRLAGELAAAFQRFPG
ncbi:MAG: HK97 family phage prohead protease, partial [Pseudomonas sp.]|uniref:HK97 family phage prohead protease n=1 Tax=Pseudomonas sp. TaxID=306 RepID=UPI003BB7B267